MNDPSCSFAIVPCPSCSWVLMAPHGSSFVKGALHFFFLVLLD